MKKIAILGVLAATTVAMPEPPEKITGSLRRINVDESYIVLWPDIRVDITRETRLRLLLASDTPITLDSVATLTEQLDLLVTAECEGGSHAARSVIFTADPGLRGRLYSVDVEGRQLVMLQPTPRKTFVTWIVHVTPQTKLRFRKDDKTAAETDLVELLRWTKDRRTFTMRVRPTKPVEEGDDSATARSITFIEADKP